VRILVVGRYLVLYEPAPDRVEVVRILHGARYLRDLRP
jgi:plasmid stabilization system protein ParE